MGMLCYVAVASPGMAQVRVEGLAPPAPSSPRTWLAWLESVVPPSHRTERPVAEAPSAAIPGYYDYERCSHAVEAPDSLLVLPGESQVHVWQVHLGKTIFYNYLSPPSTIGDTLRLRVTDAICRKGEVVIVGVADGFAVGLKATSFNYDAAGFAWAGGAFSLASNGGRILVGPSARTDGPGETAAADTAMVEDRGIGSDRFVRVRGTRSYNDSVALADRSRLLASAREVARRETERAAVLRAKGWSAVVTTLVTARRIGIGMTAEQVRAAWGAPTRVNVTLSGNVRLEQWVYASGNYVYFADGLVRTIQQ